MTNVWNLTIFRVFSSFVCSPVRFCDTLSLLRFPPLAWLSTATPCLCCSRPLSFANEFPATSTLPGPARSETVPSHHTGSSSATSRHPGREIRLPTSSRVTGRECCTYQLGLGKQHLPTPWSSCRALFRWEWDAIGHGAGRNGAECAGLKLGGGSGLLSWRKRTRWFFVCFFFVVLLLKKSVCCLGIADAKISIKSIKLIKPDPQILSAKPFSPWFDMLPVCAGKPLLPSSKLSAHAFKPRC